MDLRDKKIVVTGAFGALGRVVAGALKNAGAEVACVDRGSTSPLSERDFVVIAAVDLSDDVAANRAIEFATARLGQLDALVNIAGGFASEKVDGGSLSTWDRLYDMNVRTTFNASRAALPKLAANGRIVNIGAAGAVKAGTGMGPYAASKAGVAKLTEALAEELKDRGITVNAVLPSIIDTPANRADMPEADFDRWVKPQQIADLIVFLVSDRASAITGALVPITGRL